MIVQKKGAILILSGPSGCGKSTLLKEVFKEVNDYYFSISTTTRAKREGETDGVDYFFVSKEEFEKDIEEGSFLEHANVHGNYYGTSLKPILEALQQNKLVVFDIDVQGHKIVRKKLNDLITSVFITTPSLQELKNRLNNRSTDAKEVIEKRIENAQEEIKSFLKYDYLIVNDDLKEASTKLISIAQAARVKSKISDEAVIEAWLID